MDDSPWADSSPSKIPPLPSSSTTTHPHPNPIRTTSSSSANDDPWSTFPSSSKIHNLDTDSENRRSLVVERNGREDGDEEEEEDDAFGEAERSAFADVNVNGSDKRSNGSGGDRAEEERDKNENGEETGYLEPAKGEVPPLPIAGSPSKKGKERELSADSLPIHSTSKSTAHSNARPDPIQIDSTTFPLPKASMPSQFPPTPTLSITPSTPLKDQPPDFTSRQKSDLNRGFGSSFDAEDDGEGNDTFDSEPFSPADEGSVLARTANDTNGQKENTTEEADEFTFDDDPDNGNFFFSNEGNMVQPSNIDDDDDFGDFGEFDDGETTSGMISSQNGVIKAEGQDGFGVGESDFGIGRGMDASGGEGFTEEPEAWAEGEGVPEALIPLSLTPLPPLPLLISQITQILTPTFPSLSSSGTVPTNNDGIVGGSGYVGGFANVNGTGPVEGLNDEPVRMVEGLSGILFTNSSRQLYSQMTTPPTLKPLDWTRSRVRREHLISLGVPVNLDEVESHRLTALPPLRINTTGGSLITPRSSLQTDRQNPNQNRLGSPLAEGSDSKSRSKSRGRDEKGLGERPVMDREKAKRLLAYKEAELALFPPKYLSKMQDDLVEACSSASSVLAHLKQLVEIRQDDNKRKNEQIAELIGRAQRLKADEALANSGGLFRKGSTKRDSRTLSGSNTPKRTGSPAAFR